MKFSKEIYFTVHKIGNSGKLEAIRQHGWRFAVADTYCNPIEHLDIYMHKDKPSKRWIIDCPFTGYSLMQGYQGETRDKLAQRFIDCRLDAYLRLVHAKRDETGQPTYFEKLEAQYLRVLANRGDEDER